MYYGSVFEIKSLLALVVNVGPESEGKDFAERQGRRDAGGVIRITWTARGRRRYPFTQQRIRTDAIPESPPRRLPVHVDLA